MPLFQQAVVKKYINNLNKNELQTAWQLFTAHFHDAAKQANIRNLKEEEYQEGFVRDLFVSVFGYRMVAICCSTKSKSAIHTKHHSANRCSN